MEMVEMIITVLEIEYPTMTGRQVTDVEGMAQLVADQYRNEWPADTSPLRSSLRQFVRQMITAGDFA